MKKFKSVFYGIYILYFAFSAFLAFNYEDLVLNWNWDWIDGWTELLRNVLYLGGIGTILFATEMIVENIHILAKNRKIKSLENQVLDLKAKLYDQDKQPEIPVQSTPSEPDPKNEPDTN